MITFNAESDPVATVIIIAWKTAPHLRTCLDALVAHVRDTPYEVVLILNEPAEELVRFVEHETEGIRTITTRVNVGYGGAVNLGVERARGEFVVLLNDDTEISQHWLEPLIDTVRRRPRAAAVGSTTLFPDGSIQEAGSVVWSDGSSVKVGRGLPGTSRAFDYERRVDHCSGTSLLVRKTSWDAIGGMDAERYFPAYYEDTDFCLRLIERGEQVWYQPRSYVRHLESASTNSLYRDFLFERNRAAFVDRWEEQLRQHVVPNACGDIEIAEAVWRAMGRPIRVLGVCESVVNHLDLLSFLQADDQCHLTVFSYDAVPDDAVLCAQGIGIIEGEDTALEREFGASKYDLVVDLRNRESRQFSEKVFDRQIDVPVARLLAFHDNEVMVDIAGLPGCDSPTGWSDVVGILIKEIRERREPGEGS